MHCQQQQQDYAYFFQEKVCDGKLTVIPVGWKEETPDMHEKTLVRHWLNQLIFL